MTIDEAITDLSIQQQVKYLTGKYHQAEAIRLGLEALKEVKASREEAYSEDTGLLPGETEEYSAYD